MIPHETHMRGISVHIYHRPYIFQDGWNYDIRLGKPIRRRRKIIICAHEASIFYQNIYMHKHEDIPGNILLHQTVIQIIIMCYTLLKFN